jgi:hypothetical protein
VLLLPQNLGRRYIRLWRHAVSLRHHRRQKTVTALAFRNAHLARRCLRWLRNAALEHGAQLRVMRRAWIRFAATTRHLRSLRLRGVKTERRVADVRKRGVWRVWRRERFVQSIITTAGVEKVQNPRMCVLALYSLAVWRKNDNLALLIRCWRAWRNSIHRCVGACGCRVRTRIHFRVRVRAHGPLCSSVFMSPSVSSICVVVPCMSCSSRLPLSVLLCACARADASFGSSSSS